MDINTDNGSYLIGNINDLKLHYGYFAIKNKNNDNYLQKIIT